MSENAKPQNLSDIQIVYPGDGIDMESDVLIPNKTALFRSDPNFPLLLDMTYRLVGAKSDLVFASAACSIVEGDSILAFHNSLGGGPATLNGYDKSPKAINTARKGRFILTAGSRYGMQNADYVDRQVRQLEEYGFGTEFRSEGWMSDKSYDDEGHYLVDAGEVRQGHNMAFKVADLTEEVPLEGEADLVVANNVLYYLSPKRAMMFARNLGRMLNDRAVLSLGNVSDPNDLIMKGNSRAENMPYDAWLRHVVRMLETEFSLRYEPVRERKDSLGRRENLTLFVRD